MFDVQQCDNYWEGILLHSVGRPGIMTALPVSGWMSTVSDFKLWPFLHTSLSIYGWWKFICFCKWLCSYKFERIALYCYTLQDSCDRAGVWLVYNNWICLQGTIICLTACDAGPFPYFCYRFDKRSMNISCKFLLSATFFSMHFFFLFFFFKFWTSTQLFWKQI